MYFVCNNARFRFFNGKDIYTVEYTYSLSKWFIFKNEEHSDCVYQKENKASTFKKIDCWSAENVLNEYLESENK